MRYLDSFAVVDDYRVRFRFKNPDAQFLPSRGTPDISQRAIMIKLVKISFLENLSVRVRINL